MKERKIGFMIFSKLKGYFIKSLAYVSWEDRGAVSEIKLLVVEITEVEHWL